MLTSLGDIWPLETTLDLEQLNIELEAFESDWKQYNPRKSHIKRSGLSLTSLDGGLSGVPDLDSLAEYNRQNNTDHQEYDFKTLTNVFKNSSVLTESLSPFQGHLCRSHFIKLDAGGFFPPHRDGAGYLAKKNKINSFRILSTINNCDNSEFVFLYNNERVILSPGKLYFVNTLKAHSVFSYVNDSIQLVLNVGLSEEIVKRTIQLRADK
jgi:hypothetical protein